MSDLEIDGYVYRHFPSDIVREGRPYRLIRGPSPAPPEALISLNQRRHAEASAARLAIVQDLCGRDGFPYLPPKGYSGNARAYKDAVRYLIDEAGYVRHGPYVLAPTQRIR